MMRGADSPQDLSDVTAAGVGQHPASGKNRMVDQRNQAAQNLQQRHLAVDHTESPSFPHGSSSAVEPARFVCRKLAPSACRAAINRSKQNSQPSIKIDTYDGILLTGTEQVSNRTSNVL
jgi:hypothetical protein